FRLPAPDARRGDRDGRGPARGAAALQRAHPAPHARDGVGERRLRELVHGLGGAHPDALAGVHLALPADHAQLRRRELRARAAGRGRARARGGAGGPRAGPVSALALPLAYHELLLALPALVPALVIVAGLLVLAARDRRRGRSRAG